MLSISIPEVIGHLHCFWWWALDYAQDGDLSKYDIHDIAEASLWTGDAETLFAALKETGFIRGEEATCFIHDWMDYAGRLIERRQKDAERKRKSRDVQGTSDGQRTESGVTVPYRTVPNQEIKDYILQISDLRDRYSPDQLKTIDEYFDILRWTRKNGVIAESRICKIYVEWQRFKPETVMYGLSLYIKNSKYHDKKEEYCYAIMRNATSEQVGGNGSGDKQYKPRESY